MSFNDTNIRWTDKNHNAVWGCSKTSEGCMHCYAERVSSKYGHTHEPWTVEHAEENITLKPGHLEDRLGKPAWVFVNSMSDMFHERVPDEFILEYYDEICRRHSGSAFQMLTKHGADDDRDIPHPPDNVMLGVSVESPRRLYRVDWLREQPAATKFISFEPLVEQVRMPDLTGIDWAIIGGESHPDPDERREMDPKWARHLVYWCHREGVSVFFKQHSGPRPEMDIELDLGNGKERVEEFPLMPAGVLPKPKKHMPSTEQTTL